MGTTTNEKVQSGKARPSSLSDAVRLTVLPPPPAPPQGQPVDRLRNPAGEQIGVIACGGVAIVSMAGGTGLCVGWVWVVKNGLRLRAKRVCGGGGDGGARVKFQMHLSQHLRSKWGSYMLGKQIPKGCPASNLLSISIVPQLFLWFQVGCPSYSYKQQGDTHK